MKHHLIGQLQRRFFKYFFPFFHSILSMHVERKNKFEMLSGTLKPLQSHKTRILLNHC